MQQAVLQPSAAPAGDGAGGSLDGSQPDPPAATTDARSAGGGAGGAATAAAAAAGAEPSGSGGESGGEVAALRSQVAELRALVEAQSAALTAQRESLEAHAAALRELRPPAAPPQRDGSGDGGARAAAPRGGVRPFDAQLAAAHDRRILGQPDWRFHSTSSGAIPPDMRVLPKRIILVRHAESEGNVDARKYTYVPDPMVALSPHGHEQAADAGAEIRGIMEAATAGGGAAKTDYRLYFYISPYLRSRQTYEGIRAAFGPDQVAGMQEEVQLREQDFGNFQDADQKEREKAERLRFGRFFYRFPNGESGADVYDRITNFQDHLVRDINAGRFKRDTSLVLVTHGLALRIFLMRWYHWTVNDFLRVYNPGNAVPIVLERVDAAPPTFGDPRSPGWAHTKCLYRLAPASMAHLEGCTPDMCHTGDEPRPGGEEGRPDLAALEAWHEAAAAAGPMAEEAEGVEAAARGAGGSAAAQWAQLGGGWEGEMW
ncbi:MAG: histidine phosphatase superfamily [Monoraphidium minutum]|nr:MAG: histidine phosphatase superfamily [Monoraphidium minutum]